MAIVNAAMIGQSRSREKNGGLGCNCGGGLFHQRVLRVAQRAKGKLIVICMLTHSSGSLVAVWIDEPELDVQGVEFSLQAADLWRVPIGNGTFRTEKNQHDGFVGDLLQRVHALTGQIEGRASFRGRAASVNRCAFNEDNRQRY